jgi:hypothetical protein
MTPTTELTMGALLAAAAFGVTARFEPRRSTG